MINAFWNTVPFSQDKIDKAGHLIDRSERVFHLFSSGTSRKIIHTVERTKILISNLYVTFAFPVHIEFFLNSVNES